MSKETLFSYLPVALLGALLAAGGPPLAAAPAASLSAGEVVSRNLEARGGVAAWRAVQTLSYAGKMEAGGKKNMELPFVMDLKRPHKTRVELEFQSAKAIQVYDGTQGWKLRPYLGRNDVEPYSSEELKIAAAEPELDGPLMDYAAKGTKVDLEGTEKVDGREAYRLKLTQKDGRVRHLWIDAQTFLEVKIDGSPRRMDGKMRNVAIYYRDYKNVSGLKIPYLVETSVQGAKQSHKMTIEQVVVNPKLDDALFMAPKPQPAVMAQTAAAPPVTARAATTAPPAKAAH